MAYEEVGASLALSMQGNGFDSRIRRQVFASIVKRISHGPPKSGLQVQFLLEVPSINKGPNNG